MLVATGGAGQLFAVTTNPAESTGDGIAMALRAGVAVADVEFVQFHPTALHHPAMPRPLLSEALRGHGALLRGRHGERFVDELLPRDKVEPGDHGRACSSRASTTCGSTPPGSSGFDERFPTIAAALAEVGLDPARDWLPVAPAAHYLCGGVVTDLDGATVAARPVGGGRGGVHRRPRRQPPGLQLAARGHGLRAPGGRGDRRAAATAPARPAPCGPCWAARPGRRSAGRRLSCAGRGPAGSVTATPARLDPDRGRAGSSGR